MRARKRVLFPSAAVVGFTAVVFAVSGRRDSAGNAASDIASVTSGVERISEDPLTTVYRDTVPVCATCDIRVTPVGQFGRPEDDILVRDIPLVERDSRGRLYATVRGAQDHELIVYDSAANILGTIGRYGNGPGEFRSVMDVRVGPGDSLHVMHEDRLSVFDPAGRLARTIRVDIPPGMHPLRKLVGLHKDTIVITAFTSEDSLNFPLHVYNAEGRYLRSVGPPTFGSAHRTQTRADGQPVSVVSGSRTNGWSDEPSVWLTGDGGYRVENVDLQGRVRRVIGVVAPSDWNHTTLYITRAEYAVAAASFPRQTLKATPSHVHPGVPRPTERRPTVRPRSYLANVGVLDDSMIVVLVHVPATNWQDAVVRLDTTKYSVESIPEPGYRQQLYDTVLDVIDTRTGAVFARKRLTGMFYMTSDRTLYRIKISEEGVIGFELFTLDMDRQ